MGVGCNYTAPGGFYTADNHGADQNQCHGAGFGIKDTGHPLVAGEQVGYVFRGYRVNGEQLARHVDHFPKGAGQRHVHPVVVFR